MSSLAGSARTYNYLFIYQVNNLVKMTINRDFLSFELKISSRIKILVRSPQKFNLYYNYTKFILYRTTYIIQNLYLIYKLDYRTTVVENSTHFYYANDSYVSAL